MFSQPGRTSDPTFFANSFMSLLQDLSKISDDPIFFNNSNNPQMPVEDQLAIALYRFGHEGNAASLQSVANWAGVGKGTITLCTRCVMVAVPKDRLRQLVLVVNFFFPPPCAVDMLPP
jgi:hypothetical protein